MIYTTFKALLFLSSIGKEDDLTTGACCNNFVIFMVLQHSSHFSLMLPSICFYFLFDFLSEYCKFNFFALGWSNHKCRSRFKSYRGGSCRMWCKHHGWLLWSIWGCWSSTGYF